MSYDTTYRFSRFAIIIYYILSFYARVGVGVGDLKIEESEVLCTDSTAMVNYN
jgi:hypothetical protein